MGLDAVVYKNLRNVAIQVELDTLTVDPVTGEPYFEDDNIAQTWPAETFQAINRRLGNVAELRQILEEICEVLPSDSVLRSKILKSFSHSGDVIGGEELERLDYEIRLTKNRTEFRRSSALTEFLKNLEELTRIAQEQENPIVFL